MANALSASDITGTGIQANPSYTPCDYSTLRPSSICKWDCAHSPGGGKQYDVCGVCGGDGTSCKITSECPVLNCTICCGCDHRLRPVLPDKCGMCGGNSTTCLGCDGIPFSGKVFDACGICGGDGASCVGCDGVKDSGKVPDLCGVCDGGNRNRDICGVCTTDPSKRDHSCQGCDGVPFSGRAMDACKVCGGTNLCMWRDGNPPASANGATVAITKDVTISASNRRSLLERILSVSSAPPRLLTPRLTSASCWLTLLATCLALVAALR